MKTVAITEQPGFKSVARAIRYATVYATEKGGSNREVQSGLADAWRAQIAEGEKALIGAIADFVQRFNWESTQIGAKAHTVKTAELDDLFALVEAHGAELVGKLLLAYGHSRAPKTTAPAPKKKAGKKA